MSDRITLRHAPHSGEASDLICIYNEMARRCPPKFIRVQHFQYNIFRSLKKGYKIAFTSYVESSPEESLLELHLGFTYRNQYHGQNLKPSF